MTMDRRKRLATKLMAAAFLLASVRVEPTTSAETIAKTFFYNPPSNGGPPPDVMAMLAAGKTSGMPTFSVFGDVFSPDPSDLRSISDGQKDNFLSGQPSAIDQEFFHNPDFLEPNYKAAVHWEPTREVSNDENGEFSNSYTPTSWEGQTHLGGNDDRLPAIIREDLSENEKPRPDLSLQDQEIAPENDPQSSGDFSDKLSLDVTPDAEMTLAASTDRSSQKTDKIGTDFPETTSISNEFQDFENSTEFEKEQLTSSNPVEAMTLDDSDGEITTLISLVPDSYAENENHYSADAKKVQTKKETNNNEGKKTKEGNKLSDINLHPADFLKVPHDAEEQKENPNSNYKTKSPIESRMNSIFFTIDEGPNEHGEIKVKIGKALDYSSNQNAIEKNFQDVYQYNFHDPNTGWYKFGYGDNQQWRHEERSGDGVVLGRYGWHDANGREHTTHFVADAKGYRTVEPGQKITMHVATPTNVQSSNKNKAGAPSPSSLITAPPSFLGGPTSQPLYHTTAPFPITSVSTTVTLSTHASPPDLSSASYPGTVTELVRPGTDISVVTGRPPIAYPLPPQSVSSRPGSWIFVPSTARPMVRPPFRPLRPMRDRPIKSPFKEVNRNRHKLATIRPLKPLQVNLKRGSKPQHDSHAEDPNDSMVSDEEQEGEENSSPNSVPLIDLIGQMQLFFNDSLNHPLKQDNAPEAPTVPVPMQSDDSGTFTPSELMHFINFINSLKAQNQEAATSINRPAWSKPQTDHGENVKGQASLYLKAPSSILQPPPLPSSSSSNEGSSSSSFHWVQDASGDIPHPLDYAFMDEDHPLMDLNSVIIQNSDKPSNDSIHTSSLNNGTLAKIQGDSSPNKNDVSEPWKIPDLAMENISDNQLNKTSHERNENNSGSKISKEKNGSQPQDDNDEITTLIPFTPSSAKPFIEKKSTVPTELLSSSTGKPSMDGIWPYIPMSSHTSSKPVSTNVKTTLPPPPSTQTFWTEVLKRLYYWPHAGPQDERPTTIQ
ncbi:uncharacterized protein [Macrobrachium rosenbergii]|uniref:uncharacterized protein isoform X2 n=1 Tax=Macrobrachium rosenbergii TaxID=79674 RepID=UPI0034D5FBBA